VVVLVRPQGLLGSQAFAGSGGILTTIMERLRHRKSKGVE